MYGDKEDHYKEFIEKNWFKDSGQGSEGPESSAGPDIITDGTTVDVPTDFSDTATGAEGPGNPDIEVPEWARRNEEEMDELTKQPLGERGRLPPSSDHGLFDLGSSGTGGNSLGMTGKGVRPSAVSGGGSEESFDWDEFLQKIDQVLGFTANDLEEQDTDIEKQVRTEPAVIGQQLETGRDSGIFGEEYGEQYSGIQDIIRKRDISDMREIQNKKRQITQELGEILGKRTIDFGEGGLESTYFAGDLIDVEVADEGNDIIVRYHPRSAEISEDVEDPEETVALLHMLTRAVAPYEGAGNFDTFEDGSYEIRMSNVTEYGDELFEAEMDRVKKGAFLAGALNSMFEEEDYGSESLLGFDYSS